MTRQEFIKRLEEEVKQYKADLVDLESGKVILGQKNAASPFEWIDTTQSEIAWYKGVIANHEAVISKLKSDTF